MTEQTRQTDRLTGKETEETSAVGKETNPCQENQQRQNLKSDEIECCKSQQHSIKSSAPCCQPHLRQKENDFNDPQIASPSSKPVREQKRWRRFVRSIFQYETTRYFWNTYLSLLVSLGLKDYETALLSDYPCCADDLETPQQREWLRIRLLQSIKPNSITVRYDERHLEAGVRDFELTPILPEQMWKESPENASMRKMVLSVRRDAP